MALVTEENLKTLAAGAAEAVAEEVKDWDSVSSSAYEALHAVKKAEVTEVRSYAQPPAGVKKVMEAALIALGSSDVSWMAAKKFLASSARGGLANAFADFDPKRVDAKLVAELKPYVEDVELQPERAKTVSMACASIAMWVQAVYQYGCQ